MFERLNKLYYYCLCFREEMIKLTAQYQYEDNQVGDEDAFAREPFILRFCCPSTVVKDLVLIPVHTKPEDSVKELDELYDVVNAVRQWKTNNIMILGDFNADGRYLSKKKKESIRISSDPFYWLIDDDVDTTTSNYNDNTYDRIVVYGEEMLGAIVPDSAKSFNFQVEFGLTDENAGNISDHYPVEVELETVQKAVKPKKKALPRTRKRSPKEKAQRKSLFISTNRIRKYDQAIKIQDFWSKKEKRTITCIQDANKKATLSHFNQSLPNSWFIRSSCSLYFCGKLNVE
ncbi:deoxyribonuclease gamma-like [Poeciliopsis prolifica]|uniref:deoxyribonuclease gamma-like n=1 Tax=Poeciliopsis prolifica TaxID=188132 RepID=UPI0024144F0C|nr:deoxyribonuclease gamma-like [Poeciliopsis prolifica]